MALVWCLPSLSGDLYRYRWEGRARMHGLNPYLLQPDQPEAAFLRDATYPLISSPFRKAGYGPLWIEVEHGIARLAAALTEDPWVQVILCKAPSIAADLAALLLLALLLRQRGLSFDRWAIYAWCPTPIVEFWHEGHNDSWIVASLLLALLLAGRSRWIGAFASLTIGALTKFWPALLFPLFAFAPTERRDSPRWWQWLVAIPMCLPFVFLFWAQVNENVDFMSGFLGGWRNNDSLFAVVLWIAGPLRAKYLVAALLLGWLALLIALRVELGKAVLAFTAGMLLISANVHPWYLTWFAPLLPLYPSAALFLWIGLMPLAYGVLAEFHATGVWQGSTPRRWWIYAPVLLAFALRRRIH